MPYENTSCSTSFCVNKFYVFSYLDAKVTLRITEPCPSKGVKYYISFYLSNYFMRPTILCGPSIDGEAQWAVEPHTFQGRAWQGHPQKSRIACPFEVQIPPASAWKVSRRWCLVFGLRLFVRRSWRKRIATYIHINKQANKQTFCINYRQWTTRKKPLATS